MKKTFKKIPIGMEQEQAEGWHALGWLILIVCIFIVLCVLTKTCINHLRP
jgi:flagellar biosynthesis/type III secretory pathway M-ring protein FliF/YscJ